MAVPHCATGPLDSLKKEEISWELLQHSPYSPDLAPSNFNLFEPQNESLGDIKFKNDEDVLQQNVQKFLQVPIKSLMLRVPADL